MGIICADDDVVKLWAFGLNLAVAALGVVVIPVITASGYLSLERYRNKDECKSS